MSTRIIRSSISVLCGQVYISNILRNIRWKPRTHFESHIVRLRVVVSVLELVAFCECDTQAERWQYVLVLVTVGLFQSVVA